MPHALVSSIHRNESVGLPKSKYRHTFWTTSKSENPIDLDSSSLNLQQIEAICPQFCIEIRETFGKIPQLRTTRAVARASKPGIPLHRALTRDYYCPYTVVLLCSRSWKDQRRAPPTTGRLSDPGERTIHLRLSRNNFRNWGCQCLIEIAFLDLTVDFFFRFSEHSQLEL